MEMLFHGVPLAVAPGRVFTPRPTTEALVDAALEQIEAGAERVADVGTGSGAVAVTIGLAAPEVEVFATDSSPEAVELARLNVARHGLEDRVHVLEGDLLDPIPDPVDLVVANLPYLPEASRFEPAHAQYRAEPATAVYAAGDGLGPYRRLLAACEDGKLVHGGLVLLQFHRRILVADCEHLRELRARLERDALAAA